MIGGGEYLSPKTVINFYKKWGDISPLKISCADIE